MNRETKRILLVDDEPHRIAPWKEALAQLERIEVELIEEADDLLGRLQSNAPPPHLVVLDVMMPTPGGLSDKETEYGSRTGGALYHRLRDVWTEVPVVFLTNLSDYGLRERLELGNDDLIVNKAEGPAALVSVVVDRLSDL